MWLYEEIQKTGLFLKGSLFHTNDYAFMENRHEVESSTFADPFDSQWIIEINLIFSYKNMGIPIQGQGLGH